jgi:plasmid rolling circle replication initiator protein Rep
MEMQRGVGIDRLERETVERYIKPSSFLFSTKCTANMLGRTSQKLYFQRIIIFYVISSGGDLLEKLLSLYIAHVYQAHNQAIVLNERCASKVK